MNSGRTLAAATAIAAEAAIAVVIGVVAVVEYRSAGEDTSVVHFF